MDVRSTDNFCCTYVCVQLLHLLAAIDLLKTFPREARLINLSGRAELSRANLSEKYIYIYICICIVEGVRNVAWQQ